MSYFDFDPTTATALDMARRNVRAAQMCRLDGSDRQRRQSSADLPALRVTLAAIEADPTLPTPPLWPTIEEVPA